MKIIDLNNYEEKKHETAVALGNFDGIHIGHQYLIEEMIKKAKERNLKSSILLFKNHTRTILKNKCKTPLYIITSNNQKLEILNQLGIETVYTINFDENIMKLSSKEFVENIIVRKLNSKLVTVGFDYKFGYKALGDSNYLKKLGMEKGFSVDVIDPIYVGEDIVSSTIIRNLIKLGDIDKGNKLLGRYYTITGTIIGGKNRGSKIGYPTANIKLDHNYIIPKTGVYKTITLLGDKKYLSLTSIGYNPTFKEKELKIENHILNFSHNIYGKPIKIEFIKFIRDNIKFGTVEELIKQIKMDIESVK